MSSLFDLADEPFAAPVVEVRTIGLAVWGHNLVAHVRLLQHRQVEVFVVTPEGALVLPGEIDLTVKRQVSHAAKARAQWVGLVGRNLREKFGTGDELPLLDITILCWPWEREDLVQGLPWVRTWRAPLADEGTLSKAELILFFKSGSAAA